MRLEGTRLDRGWIAAHIAHQDRMCLLDQVLSWDPQQLLCRAGNHRAADHPLRAHGRLGSACAIEYAAQAVAVHGALLQPLPDPGGLAAPGGPTAGLRILASARAVELTVGRLDDIGGDLLISACRLHANERSALYSFELHEAAATGLQRRLAQGRLSLWLDTPAARGRSNR